MSMTLGPQRTPAVRPKSVSTLLSAARSSAGESRVSARAQRLAKSSCSVKPHGAVRQSEERAVIRAILRASTSCRARRTFAAGAPTLLPNPKPIGAGAVASGADDCIKHSECGAVFGRIVNPKNACAIHCRYHVGSDRADKAPVDGRAQKRAKDGFAGNANEDW